MYVCIECGETFDRAEHVIDRHGLDTPPYEEYDCCPHCFSWSFIDAFSCAACGETIVNDFVEIGDDRYCESCYTLSTLSDLL